MNETDLLAAEIDLRRVVDQRHGSRGPVTTEADVHGPDLAVGQRDDVHQVDPAREFTGRHGVDAWSGACWPKVDGKTQESEDVVEEDMIAHAVAPTAARLLDDLVKVAESGDVDSVGWIVVQPEVVVRDCCNQMDMELREEVDVLCGVLQRLVYSQAGRKADVVVKGIDMSLTEGGRNDHGCERVRAVQCCCK